MIRGTEGQQRPEVLHNMWNLKVAPYPAGKELAHDYRCRKIEIKMSFLKDVFQTG